MREILNNIQSEITSCKQEKDIATQRELGNKIINYFNVLQDIKNTLFLMDDKSEIIFNNIKDEIRDENIDNKTLKSKFTKRKNTTGKINYKNILDMDLETFTENYSFILSFEKKVFTNKYIIDISKVQQEIISLMIETILFMMKSVARGKDDNFSILVSKSIEYLYQYEKDCDCKYTTWIWKRLNTINIDYINKINKKTELYYNYMIETGVNEKNELTGKSKFKQIDDDLQDGYYENDTQIDVVSFDNIVSLVLKSNTLTNKEEKQFLNFIEGGTSFISYETKIKIQGLLKINDFTDIYSPKKYY